MQIPEKCLFSFFNKQGLIRWKTSWPCAAAPPPIAGSRQVCWRCYLNSSTTAPARETAGSSWLGSSTCFLGAAQEGCFIPLVKQINADIMHHQRFFYQCKQLVLPLALINNQLCDHLCFLAHYFLPPHRGNQRRWLNFLSIIPVPWL